MINYSRDCGLSFCQECLVGGQEALGVRCSKGGSDWLWRGSSAPWGKTDCPGVVQPPPLGIFEVWLGKSLSNQLWPCSWLCSGWVPSFQNYPTSFKVDRLLGEWGRETKDFVASLSRRKVERKVGFFVPVNTSEGLVDKYQRYKIIPKQGQDQRTVSWLEVHWEGKLETEFLRGMKLWKESPGGTPRGKKICNSWRWTVQGYGRNLTEVIDVLGICC